jgi:predicted PurR-regulated permease PerM
MEFFIPGMVLFLIFLVLAFYFVPKATPMIAAILSIAFLIYGVRDHAQRFSSEYRLSTWQEGLKIYAPAIMLLVIIVFVIYSIMAFFTSGSVPVPSIPNVEIPTMNEITTNITNTINTAANNINKELNLTNTNKKNNTLMETITGNNNTVKRNNTTNKKNNNTSGFRKSMLETI